MNRLSILLLFISLTTFAQTEIPFTLTDGGHTLVKAKINGIEGMFIFDTGAGLNMVTKKFADKVGTLQKTDEFYVGHRATGTGPRDADNPGAGAAVGEERLDRRAQERAHLGAVVVAGNDRVGAEDVAKNNRILDNDRHVHRPPRCEPDEAAHIHAWQRVVECARHRLEGDSGQRWGQRHVRSTLR